ncbi:MAG: DUF7010 family protein [Novosphingobium sp.]|jgi:hypothetical protein|nr:hypothetical protein [Novosphingobium sp.]
MDRIAAQADLRKAHLNGAPGVLVSGLVWLASGLTWHLVGPGEAFIFLFFGGVAIAPVAALLTRFLFKAPPATIGKPLEKIALVTVPIILAGFYFAWRWFGMKSAEAIPVVAIAIGLRYLTFKAMFGTGAFLMLGGTFILIGTAALLVGSNLAGASALLLGLVELAFFAALYRTWRRPLGGGA